MALLPWDDEEKKKDELTAPGIAHIASVQSGSWQPAPSGADSAAATDDVTQGQPQQGGIFGQSQPAQQQPDSSPNYLMSDEHTQAVQQKQQRDAEIEQARIEQDQARQRAEAAAAVSENFQHGRATDSQGQAIDVKALKDDNGWKKYYDDTFKKEKDSLDFWGRLMDGGQASKRAEVLARNKYANELITRAYDDNGNTIDQGAADYAKKVTAYNKALAEDNSTRSRALGEAIGAFDKPGEDGGFWGRVKNAINAEKQMNIYDAVAGADDSTKTNLNDLGRFGGSLVQGFGTMPVIGAKELYEAGVGHGTDAATGLQKDLSTSERIGRGISGGLNVVTPFVGGSGKLLDSFTTKAMTKGLSEAEGAVATQLATRIASGAASETEQKVFASLAAKAANNAATQAEKSALAKLTSKIILPAVEQGGIGSAQAGAEYFGNGHDLVDENGNLDMEKVKDLLKQTGEAGATGFAGGLVLGGAGEGVRALRNRGADIPTLSPADLHELETSNTNSGAAALESARAVDATGEGLQSLENGVVPAEAPVADGISTPEAPATDVPGQVTDVTPTSQNANVPSTPATPDLLTANADVTPADGVVQTAPADVTPVRDAPQIDQPLPADAAPADVPAPVPGEVTPATQPVADGTVLPTNVAPVRDTPVLPTEEARVLQESKAGKSQADEAAINQELQQLDNAKPVIDNVPDMPVTPDGTLTPAQVAERLMPKLADNSDVKQRIADAAGMGKDTASPIEDILRDGNVNPKRAERITKHFNDLEEQVQRYNSLEEQNQKAYADGGTDALDPEVSKNRSRAAREMGQTTRRLMNEVKKMEGSRDHKVALMHGISDIIGTRNANVLTSAGLLERNLFQELTANVKLAAKNPIKMLRSTFGNGNIIKDTAKSELSHWADRPSVNPIDAVKYVVGNTYRTGMTPTTILANTRRGAIRDELTRWAFQELEGRKVSLSEAHKLAGTAGNEMEALVNTVAGVDNGMTNRAQAKKAIDAWKEYIRTGDDGAKAEFLRHVDEHTSLADQMIAGLSKDDQIRAKGLKAVGQLIFPFVRTATNLTKNAFQQDLNPFAKSLLDEIKADQTGKVGNSINLIKSKLVDYGIMGGAAALASSGTLVYNDGDEVDKPKGWSLHIPGTDNYVPVRSTSLELPIAMAGTAYRMASDIAQGKQRDAGYYAGMITGSLPYIDQFNQTTGAVDSAMGAGNDSGDKGYAAKNYAVQTIKSFVPGSNNGVQAYVAGKEGNSLNAKTVYDKNFGTWLQNAIHKNYDADFYNGLKDSRDNAGRVRTVDNQGVVTNKHINDASTAEFNQRVTDLVNYGRENGLGENTQDMFNTYDTGKNNNFKSVQDSITFLDVADGGKPDNAKKLEKNGKIANLSQQMRDGFFGDTGDELLTLDGKNLYSDVSVPNKDGSKNSRLPISMQSIKNAIAQTDLPEDQRNRIKEISDQDTALYNQLKAKTITYDQYQAEKAKTGAEYVDILSSSKNYQKMLSLFDELDQTGFFNADGLGATKSGQTYLWNSLNALLGSKGATPAANYPDDSKGFTPWGRGTGRSANSGANFDGMEGLKWTPVGRRQLATVNTPKFTPFKAKVTLGNEIKKDRSQNYSDRSF